ncbi:hypothetical protein RY966_004226 [Enterobacter kobei]|nr:hypothetical protein [Enterobacter kobei]
MTKSTRNNKSEQRTVRIPLEVLAGIEETQNSDESIGQYIVAALRSEIAHRQAGGAAETSLVSALDALKRVKEIGSKAGEEINALINVADAELQRKKPEPPADSSPAPDTRTTKPRLMR